MIFSRFGYETRPRVLPGAVFICVLLSAGGALADPATLTEVGRGKATAVTGDHLRVDGVESEIVLAGIVAPRGRIEPFAAPLADEARDALAALLAGRTVSVRPIAEASDRAGRLRAHLLRDDGLWVAAELLRQGFARVALNADTDDAGADLLAAEADARKARRGLWAHPAYAPHAAEDADQLNRDVGTFQIVAGAVTSTARRGDFMYLNFGADYRDDVTVVIPRDAWTSFRKMRPLTLTGKRIEARGWVVRHNGPEIEVRSPALLNVLD